MPTITSTTNPAKEINKVKYGIDDTMHLVDLALSSGLKVTCLINDLEYHVNSQLTLISRLGRHDVICGSLSDMRRDAFDNIHFDIGLS